MKKGQLLARVDDRDLVLQRDVLRAKFEAIESQMAVVRAQTGQVDQETLRADLKAKPTARLPLKPKSRHSRCS